MFKLISFFCVFATFSANGQILKKKEDEKKLIRLPKYVATKNAFGMIAGIERGQYTFMELGVEKHWKKIRLVHAQTIGANANMEYNFGNNVLGYNTAAWAKTGRVDLTYGINLNYITDFERSRYGLGPQIGFRLLGLHFVNGYNFLLGDKELKEVNKFYVGLRYYFPLRSKTTVVNVNKRKPSEKEKAKERERRNSQPDNKGKYDDNQKKSRLNSDKKNTNASQKERPSTKKGNKHEPEIEEKFRLFKKKQIVPESRKNLKNDSKLKKLKENPKNKKENNEQEKKKFLDYFRNNK